MARKTQATFLKKSKPNVVLLRQDNTFIFSRKDIFKDKRGFSHLQLILYLMVTYFWVEEQDMKS